MKNKSKKKPQTYQIIKNNKSSSSNKIFPNQSSYQLQTFQQSNYVRKKAEADYFQDYKAANYQKAIKYMNQHSYKKKLITGQYVQVDFLQNNQLLKQSGIGIYLYLELFKRCFYIFLFMSLIMGFPIYLNLQGNTFKETSLSFGTYFIMTTLGNNNTTTTPYDAYILTGSHCAINLLFFIFVVNWNIHNHKQIQQYQQDHSIIHPAKFCVQMQGFPKKGVTNSQLQVFFSNFGPVYQCSLVYNYKDKLKYFKEIDDLDEQIKEAELQLRLGDGDVKTLKNLKNKKEALVEQINSIKISPSILSAYVHFQFQKSKIQLLNYYNNHYLFNNFFHSCLKSICCCCINNPEQRYLFRGTQLKVKSQKVTDPQQINWQSIDISLTNKIFRSLLTLIIVILFLFICSTLVALCSIFISNNSINCQGVSIPTVDKISSTTDSNQITCFCNSNLLNFDDGTVKNYCVQIFKKIYISNGLQILAALVSTLTNFIFGILVDKIIDFTKPKNFSSGLISKAFFLFLFYMINTCLLPLLLYANIYGFKIASYVSLILLILPSDTSTYFSTSGLSYYDDFTQIWYKNVSPYFTNFLVINILIIWGKFIFYSWVNNRRQGKILQKNMNKSLVSYSIDIADQQSSLFLIIFLSLIYCGGIPILIPLAMINIGSRYLTNKYLIINYSTRVNGLTQQFNSLSTNILPFAVILSSLVGIWMFTGSAQIYPSAINTNIPGTNEWQTIFVLFPRLFYVSYTLVMGIVALGYVFLYNTLIRFFAWLGGLCYQNKEQQKKTRKQIQFSKAAETLNILNSYNIHSNDKYKNIIINLQRYLQIE